jgi:superfamily I DNA/RNA helicase
LEFDHVVVVEPARLITPDNTGLRLLYVTVTRATQRLVVVHAEPLPDSLVAASSAPGTSAPASSGIVPVVGSHS